MAEARGPFPFQCLGYCISFAHESQVSGYAANGTSSVHYVLLLGAVQREQQAAADSHED